MGEAVDPESTAPIKLSESLIFLMQYSSDLKFITITASRSGFAAPAAGVIRHSQKMLKTDRSLLRQWTEDDFLPFAEICSDKDVMEYFPKPQTRDESDEMGRKILPLISERGWGFWALEIPNQHKFIGFVGLHTPTNKMPFPPCVEVDWRLSKHHWGNGYATEAAKEALRFASNKLNLNEVVSFTTQANNRSKAVMEKIGIRDSKQNFMHPDIETSHPQCEHVLYKISKQEW